jgi:hypothetical protein
MGKRWTDEERQIIRDIWSSPVFLKIDYSLLPGRSYASVAKEASKLGLGHKTKPVGPVMAKINALMQDGQPRTAKEVSKALGASRTYVHDALAAAVKRGEYHVRGFGMKPTHRRDEAAFRIGKGKSAVKPAPETPAERARRFRREVDKVEYSFKRKQYTLNRKIKVGGVRRDPLTEAFFGKAAA